MDDHRWLTTVLKNPAQRGSGVSIRTAFAFWVLAMVLGLPAGAVAQAFEPANCTPDRCTVVLSHVMSVSDDHEELHGAFGSAPVYAERDGAGRLFTAVRHGFTVFDSVGGLIARFGGSGQGPGEFIVPAAPLIGPGDSLHMFDAVQRRLTVFGPDLTLVRSVSGVGAPAALIRNDGTYVIARQVRTPDRIGFPLHLMSDQGEIMSSFGTDTAQFRMDIPLLTRRFVGLSGDGTVWAVAPGRYVLERWDPDTGTRLARLDVRPDWFQESVRHPPGGWSVPPVPTMQGVWEDRHGLIWVLVHVRSTEWAAPEQSGEFAPTPQDLAQRYDAVIEVLDPQTGEVIARQSFPDPLWVHPGSRLLTSSQTADPHVLAFDVWTAQLQPQDALRSRLGGPGVNFLVPCDPPWTFVPCSYPSAAPSRVHHSEFAHVPENRP